MIVILSGSQLSYILPSQGKEGRYVAEYEDDNGFKPGLCFGMLKSCFFRNINS